MLPVMPGLNRNDGILTPWLTPMRAARGPLRKTSVLPSFAIHLVGLGILLIGIGLFDHAFWDGELRQELVEQVMIDPAFTLLLISLYCLPLELALMLFAWLTTCWGAGVEPYRESLSRSLSRWYQLTPWLAVLTLGLMLAIQGIEELDDWYWDTYEYGRYGGYYDTHSQPMRLITRDRFRLLLDIGRFGSLGIVNLIALWWVLGTVRVHRNKPTWFASCRWPAVCEGCGYALAGLTDEQTCPECGKAVGESKHTHRGTREVPSLRMVWRGLFKPTAVGASMLTRQPTKQPLRVLLWGLLFTVLSGPVMMVINSISIWMADGYSVVDDFGEAIEFYLVAGLTVGIYAAMLGSLLLLGAGTLVGTIVRGMGKRDIMPAACSAACYTAALLPIWVLAQGLQLLILIPLGRYLSDAGRYELVDFFPLLVLLLHAFMLTYMILHITRITRAARYANV